MTTLKGTPGEARAAAAVLRGREVTVNVDVACGHLDCDWSMPVDGDVPGQDAMAVHGAYMDHLDTHYPDHADCESVERSAPVCECGLLEVECNGLDLADPSIIKLHNHARELARQLQAETSAAAGLYAGDTAEQVEAEQARIDRFMAGGEDR